MTTSWFSYYIIKEHFVFMHEKNDKIKLCNERFIILLNTSYKIYDKLLQRRILVILKEVIYLNQIPFFFFEIYLK